nr:heme-copper oxidase subunit III [Propioniciclava soli]
MVAIGTLIWLASELMFFAALFAAYFSLRDHTNATAAATGQQSMWDWGSSHFLSDPVVFGQQWPWFSMINTTILVLSSVTCQIGVFRAERGRVGRSGSIVNVAGWGMREWYLLTFLMGAVFIGGQAFEYTELVSEGFVLSTNAYTGAFFLATGFHGLHVLGGLIAFLVLIGRTYLARTFTHEQRVHAIVTSYYWHFVDVVWIILFAVIYLIR